jgi:acyl carrier protein
MNVKKEVRDYILRNYLFTADEAALADDVSLMQTGVVDSTGILELILFLEESCGIKVRDEEMIPENLDSVSNIVDFVARKRAS